MSGGGTMPSAELTLDSLTWMKLHLLRTTHDTFLHVLLNCLPRSQSCDALCVSALTARQNAFQKSRIKPNSSLFTHPKWLFVKQFVSGSCVHYNLQAPAVLHRQVSSAASHWHSFTWRDTQIWKQRFVPLGGKFNLYCNSREKLPHSCDSHLAHTEPPSFTSAQTWPCLKCWASTTPRTPYQAFHAYKEIYQPNNNLLTTWIRQGRCSGAAMHTHRAESARTAHGTMCSISSHNHKHINETPLKVSKYQDSQHGTLKTGRTEAFFWKWSFKSLYLQVPVNLLISGKESTVADQNENGFTVFKCALQLQWQKQWCAYCLWTRSHEGSSLGQRNTKIKQVTRTEKNFGIAVAPFLKAAALRQHTVGIIYYTPCNSQRRQYKSFK